MIFSQLKPSYRRVGTESLEGGADDEKEPGTCENCRLLVGGPRNIFLYVITTIFGVAMLVTLVLYQFKFSNTKKPSQSHTNTCGNSSSEALSLGCSFDQLMWAWHPKQCPHYANDEYLNAEPENPWKF
jgi:hypothetical protein